MNACLLVVIGAGPLSALTGLSMAIGAFIAGLLLAETEYRHIASIHERRDEFRKELNRPEALGGRTRRWRERRAPSKE